VTSGTGSFRVLASCVIGGGIVTAARARVIRHDG